MAPRLEASFFLTSYQTSLSLKGQAGPLNPPPVVEAGNFAAVIRQLTAGEGGSAVQAGGYAVGALQLGHEDAKQGEQVHQ